jgi:hypothetical protein
VVVRMMNAADSFCGLCLECGAQSRTRLRFSSYRTCAGSSSSRAESNFSASPTAISL